MIRGATTLFVSLVAAAALSGPSFGQAQNPNLVGTGLEAIENAPNTPEACQELIQKAKAAMPAARLDEDQKMIVERSIRWGELWQKQADEGAGNPGYRRCAISLRPAQVLLSLN